MTRTVMLLALLGIAGCATVKAEHVLTGPTRAAYSGPVKVVMDGAPLPIAYDEIGIVTATGGGNLASLPAVLDALQAEAASVGGDAVYATTVALTPRRRLVSQCISSKSAATSWTRTR